ncbi:MAG: hypothetical protein ACK56F_30275, partial [bacterium]
RGECRTPQSNRPPHSHRSPRRRVGPRPLEAASSAPRSPTRRLSDVRCDRGGARSALLPRSRRDAPSSDPPVALGGRRGQPRRGRRRIRGDQDRRAHGARFAVRE